MKFHRHVLKNGLRVITVPMKDNPTVTVLVLVETGSKYETKAKNGISHFLEHMCFKGTTKRPNAYTIASELDGLGSQYNAFTSQEYTGYYAKSDAKHFHEIFDVISDIYLHSTFPEAAIEKEKGVIVEEINMYEDMPQRHVGDVFMSLLYGDQPAGWNIAGTRENVRAMTREDFVAYHKKHYVPKATTVVVAGQISDAQVAREVKKMFSGLTYEGKGAKQKTLEKQTAPAVRVEYKKTDQAHLIVGFRALDTYDKKNPVLTVLATLLAGGMSSRLFIKLREELGVAYYVRASVDAYTDHGFLEISAGVSNNRVEEVVGEILKECKKFTTTLVSAAELGKIKEYLAGNQKLELESSDAFASFYGGQEILNKQIKHPNQLEKEIRSVTAKEVQNLAKAIFKNNRLNLAVIGPFKNPEVLTKKLSL